MQEDNVTRSQKAVKRVYNRMHQTQGHQESGKDWKGVLVTRCPGEQVMAGQKEGEGVIKPPF